MEASINLTLSPKMSKRKKGFPPTRIPGSVKNINMDRLSDVQLKQNSRRFEWSLDIAEFFGRWGLTTDVFKNKWCDRKNGLLKALSDRESMK